MGLVMMTGMEFWQITMLQDQRGEKWNNNRDEVYAKRSSDAAIDMNAEAELLLLFS
jgi:Arc/MetJ family transcription regulator